MKKILYILKSLARYFLIFVLTYLLAAYLVPKISVNNYKQEKAAITIYIQTNGVHSDIVVPAKTLVKDWTKTILYKQTLAADSTYNYLAFGWGDRAFYLETPTWAELKPSNALKAAFWLGKSAMHTVYQKDMVKNKQHIKIALTALEYENLVHYIEASFKQNKGKIIPIKTSVHYNNTDAFYKANYHYSLFNTCNTWTNNALKSCHQKACLWTPHQKGIFDLYK